eukprot:7391193-Prymnesium_polylepis.3
MSAASSERRRGLVLRWSDRKVMLVRSATRMRPCSKSSLISKTQPSHTGRVAILAEPSRVRKTCGTFLAAPTTSESSCSRPTGKPSPGSTVSGCRFGVQLDLRRGAPSTAQESPQAR